MSFSLSPVKLKLTFIFVKKLPHAGAGGVERRPAAETGSQASLEAQAVPASCCIRLRPELILEERAEKGHGEPTENHQRLSLSLRAWAHCSSSREPTGESQPGRKWSSPGQRGA